MATNVVSLITLIEKWKISLDQKGYTGAVLINVSKTFHTINHELLIAKLHAYDFFKDFPINLSKLLIKPLSLCKGQCND